MNMINIDYNLMNNHPDSMNGYTARFTDNIITRDDSLLVRLCDYFDKRIEESNSADSSIWKNNIDRQFEIIDAFKNRDYDKIHYILCNMFSSALTHGFCGGDLVAFSLTNSDVMMKKYAAYQYDKLLSLAEIIGAIEVFDPGEYSQVKYYNKYLEMSPDILLELISNKLEVDLRSPNKSNGLFGIQTCQGIYTERDFFAIAIAHHIKNFVAKSKNVSICDIGGGAGHVAYYLKKFGFDNITIVDLPTVSLVQMYFLETNLDKNKVKLLSPAQFDGKYDIVINMDSLVEMNINSAKKYISKIKENTDHFISINSEKTTNTFKVSDLCSQLKKTSRHIWYMCPGYVFEEYKGK